jgi:diguanylate cyclase (GGDEF)-like protein
MNDDSKKTQKLRFTPPAPAPADGAGQLASSSSEPAPRSSQRPSLVEWEDEEASTRTTETSIPVVPAVSVAPRAPKAVLTVVSGPSMGRVFSVVAGGETVIGRGREADVRIDDAGASRAHARVTATAEGRYILEDLGSTNGTFVDARKVDRCELRSGDRVYVGPNVVLSFAIVDAQAERVAHQLYESSVRDPLTRAHNRRYLVERLASETAYAKRHETHLALLLIDLDHFKRVNDTHGHLAGDDVLRDVSALVQRMIRVEDVFARFGGEEFVVLVRGIEHANVGRFAERLRIAVERLEVASGSETLHVTASVGYASMSELTGEDRDAESLLRLADERMYRAKTGGRNRVCGA